MHNNAPVHTAGIGQEVLDELGDGYRGLASFTTGPLLST